MIAVTNKSKADKLLPWCYLLIAIVTEVIGTSFMTEAARLGGYVGYAVMAVSLVISYYALALSVRGITVGMAYAIWEGLGLMLLALIGRFVFGDILSKLQWFGLSMALIGVVCMTLGEEHGT